MAAIPSLSGSTYIEDPQSIIAYTLNKFMRMPRHTVPLMDDHIISLPWLVAEYSKDPENLINRIQSDLQKVFNRIFNGERTVTVSVNYTLNDSISYDVTMSVIYTQLSGDIGTLGTTISLNKDSGRLIIPENNLDLFFQ
jgi:hypothetical protein